MFKTLLIDLGPPSATSGKFYIYSEATGRNKFDSAM